jgi:hypothetical protein
MFTFLRNRVTPTVEPPAEGSFRYPISYCPPIAVISPHFSAAFPAVIATDIAELARLDVRSVAAPMTLIREIDPLRWSPEFAIVVLSDYNTGLMSAADRDYIWNTFGVPAFEYLLDDAGKVVAEECEAHDGLHFDSVVENLEATIIDQECPCGRPGSRLQEKIDDTVNGIIDTSVPVRMWRNWQTRQI